MKFNKKQVPDSKMFVTLDVSSKAVGICVHCSGGRTANGVVDLTKFKGETWKRLVTLGGLVLSKIVELYCSINGGAHTEVNVYVEQPFYAPGSSHATPIIMAHGVILKTLGDYYRDRMTIFEAVHVSTWRSWFIGKDRNKKATDKKQMVKDTIKEKFGFNIESDDEADAIGLMNWVLNNKAAAGEV